MKPKARQTILGKAFEYACAVALQKATESQAVVLEDTSQLRKAQGYYARQVQSSIRVAKESWGLLSSDCRANRPHLG